MFDWLINMARKIAGVQRPETIPVALGRAVPVFDKIPPTSFTKKGPGVEAALRRALVKMTRAERLVARARGWDKGMVRADGRLR